MCAAHESTSTQTLAQSPFVVRFWVKTFYSQQANTAAFDSEDLTTARRRATRDGRPSRALARLRSAMTAASATPHNILYIVLEDFSTLSTSVFTTSTATATSVRNSPYLESLAARSVVFQRAYCQAPICNPSRTSFLTGRRPTVTGVYGNDDSFPNALPTLVDVLRAADPTAAVACAGGKIFHVACDRETRGFTSGQLLARNSSSGFAESANALIDRAVEADAAAGSSRLLSAAARQNLVLTMRGKAHEVRTHDMDKSAVTIRLLAHYARERTRFFVGVGLSSTHVQGVTVEAFKICAESAVVAEGAGPIPVEEEPPPSRALEHDPPLVTWQNWDIPRFAIGWNWQRDAIGKYYGCASHIDKQIGAMLAALDVLRLASSTSVVVHGDHGFSLGRHARWSKYNLYEDATRVPLILAVPGRRAHQVHTVIEGLDVMPTLLDLWGVGRAPAQGGEPGVDFVFGGHASGTIRLDGESLMPFLRPVGAAGDAVAPPVRSNTYARSELRMPMVLNRPTEPNLPGAKPLRSLGHGAQLYVRTVRYSYTLYLGTSMQCECATRLGVLDEALFDHHTDEGEMTNLAYDPAHSQTRGELLQMVMRDWRLTDVGMLAPNRSARLEHIGALAGCFSTLLARGGSCRNGGVGPRPARQMRQRLSG